MTTYLGKSCSFCLPRVPFVNCRQFMYLVISLLVLRAGYGIWLYQFLIIAYLFTLQHPCRTFVRKYMSFRRLLPEITMSNRLPPVLFHLIYCIYFAFSQNWCMFEVYKKKNPNNNIDCHVQESNRGSEVMIPHRKWRIITWKWLSSGATWIMSLFHDQWIRQ